MAGLSHPRSRDPRSPPSRPALLGELPRLYPCHIRAGLQPPGSRGLPSRDEPPAFSSKKTNTRMRTGLLGERDGPRSQQLAHLSRGAGESGVEVGEGGGGREAKFRRGVKRAEGTHVFKWIRIHF